MLGENILNTRAPISLMALNDNFATLHFVEDTHSLKLTLKFD